MPRLRPFVKFDKDNQVVPGSLVFSQKIPKPGKWREILANLCCDTNNSCIPIGTPSIIEPTVPLTDFNSLNFIGGPKDKLYFAIGCSNNNSIYWSIELGTSGIANIDDLIIFLNSTLATLGTFSYITDGVRYGLVLTTNMGILNNLFFNTCTIGTYIITQQNYN